jgi:uncharacterized membrane protein (DUF2068 family)
MVSRRFVDSGIRTVALFEAGKGAIVLVAGFGLLSLLHKDYQEVAESIVRHLHLNPARHLPRVFLEAATKMTETKLWLFAAGAFAYAAVRGIEAYGLWRLRAWAEWFAIVSGGIYLPVEIYELFRHATPMKAAVFVTNVAIVVYVAYVRLGRSPD